MNGGRAADPRNDTMTRTATYEAPVQLSARHHGQIIEHDALLRAEGPMVEVDRNAFGKAIRRHRPVRWQAVHTNTDRSNGREDQQSSPWYPTSQEAEAWLLKVRGLVVESVGTFSPVPDDEE
jgi:hypothetical protein